jgi:hypothetical protein
MSIPITEIMARAVWSAREKAAKQMLEEGYETVPVVEPWESLPEEVKGQACEEMRAALSALLTHIHTEA